MGLIPKSEIQTMGIEIGEIEDIDKYNNHGGCALAPALPAVAAWFSKDYVREPLVLLRFKIKCCILICTWRTRQSLIINLPPMTEVRKAGISKMVDHQLET